MQGTIANWLDAILCLESHRRWGLLSSRRCATAISPGLKRATRPLSARSVAVLRWVEEPNGEMA